jgi:hypothetical protein
MTYRQGDGLPDWRTPYSRRVEDLDPGLVEPESHALGEVIATASITAALAPFVQQLAKKAADDAYDGVRSWLHGLFQGAKAKRGPAGDRTGKLLIVRDPDPSFNLSLVIPTNLSDRAIRALDQLDLDTAVTTACRGKVAKLYIFWDEGTGRWCVEG